MRRSLRATGKQGGKSFASRLSECLFHDIIETDQEDMEEAACQVEHIVKKGIEEKICRLLGHPETCPHGKPIPPGDCCRKARETKVKFVAPLASLKPGETGTIATSRRVIRKNCRS